MANRRNEFDFTGNLGTDIEVKTLPNGSRVGHLNINVDDSYYNRDTRERVERSHWLEVTLYNDGLIKVIENYAPKGSLIRVRGGVKKQVWDSKTRKDEHGKPAKDSRIEFVGDSIDLLNTRRREADSDRADSSSEANGDPYFDAPSALEELPTSDTVGA